MRIIRARLYQQSIYSQSFHRHFLGKYSSNSVKDCLWRCQNHDYCRTATYKSIEQQCYLYEEYSYVGSILPSSDDSTVIALKICPDDDDTMQEPANLCLGPIPRSFPMQTVMNGLRLVRQYPSVNTVGVILAPNEAWVAPAGALFMNIYSFTNYSITRSVNTSKAFGYFDLDSNMNLLITTLGAGLYFQPLNKTTNYGTGYWTPCISPTNLTVGVPQVNNSIHIFNQTNGNFLYSINNSLYTYNVYSYRTFACTIHGYNLYFASNYSIQQVSISPPGGIKTLKTILSYTNRNPGFITTDASKRLYSSCDDCPSPFNKTFILTTNGTILAQWSPKLAYAQGKASKSKFYFVTSTSSNILSFYEYP